MLGHINLTLLIVSSRILLGESIYICDGDFNIAMKKCFYKFNEVFVNASMCVYEKRCNDSTFCQQMNDSAIPYLECAQAQSLLHPECATASFLSIKYGYISLLSMSSFKACTNLNWPSCNANWTETMKKCTESFSSEVSNITDTATPGDFATTCLRYNTAISKAKDCLSNLAERDYFCTDVAKTYGDIIDMHMTQINTTCDHCSSLRMTSCFALMPPFNGANGTDMQEHLCSYSGVLNKCLEPSYEHCNKRHIDNMIQPTGLKKICSQSCRGLEARRTSIEQCLTDIADITVYNYTTVCSYVNSVFWCLSQSAGTCEYLTEQLNPQLNRLYPIMASYQCNMTDGSNTYFARGCGLKKMTECLSFVLSTSEFNLENISDLKTLSQSISLWMDTQLSNRIDFCGKVRSNMAIGKQCVIDQYKKCSSNVLMSDIALRGQRDETAKIEVPQENPIAQLPDVSIMVQIPHNISYRLADPDLVMPEITFVDAFAAVHRLDMACDQDCKSVSFPWSSFECDIDLFASESRSVVWDQISGEDVTGHCLKLQKIIKCIVPKIGNCLTLYKDLNKTIDVNNPVTVRAIELCGLVIYTAPTTTTSSTSTTTSTTSSHPPITTTTGVQGLGPCLCLVLFTALTVLFYHDPVIIL